MQDRATRQQFDSNYKFAYLDDKYAYLYPLTQNNDVLNSKFWTSLPEWKPTKASYDMSEFIEGVSKSVILRACHHAGYRFEDGVWHAPTDFIPLLTDLQKEAQVMTEDVFNINTQERIEGVEEEISLADEVLESIQRASDSEYKARYKESLKVIDVLSRRIQAASVRSSSYKPRNTYVIDSGASASAVLMLSDLHIGQCITPSQVNYTNEFNIEIANMRIERVVAATQAFIDERNRSRPVTELVIMLGGDIIEGELGHSTNTDLEVTEQVIAAEEILIWTIKTLSKLCPTTSVHAVSGNHDRLPQFKRTPCDNRTIRSWDYIIYNHLRQKLAGDVNDFQIADGYIHEFETESGHTCLLFHGDQGIKYQGGIGGITPSLLKYYHRLKQTNDFDYMFLGHWHSPQLIENKIVVNGGLPGASTYGFNSGFAGGSSQVLTMLDEQYGLNTFHVMSLD